VEGIEPITVHRRSAIPAGPSDDAGGPEEHLAGARRRHLPFAPEPSEEPRQTFRPQLVGKERQARDRDLAGHPASGSGVELGRWRLVAAEQVALPVPDALDRVVIGVFGRAADEEPVAHLLLILVLRPAIARLAERHFVPLSGLVIVARLGKFLAMPHGADAVLEDIAHVGCAQPIEAAEPDAAVVMDGHGLVDDRAGDALGWLGHLREFAVLEDNAHA